MVYCRDKNKCFFGKAPSIGLVESAYGRKTAMTWMEIQLSNLSEFAGCKEKLTPAQIAETAAMILDGYPYYKLTEFMLFFQQFKRCRYGRFYGAVDPMIILQALDEFNEERRRTYIEKEAAEEKARKKDAERELEVLKQRYTSRVPDAFTEKAPINFLQYRLMGYDDYTDDEIKAECEAIRAGKKTIPTDVRQILDTIREAFSIDD